LLIRPFHSFNVVDEISKIGEQLTLGEGVSVPLGLPKVMLISLFWLLIPIDFPLRPPNDLLGLCVCCFVIIGFKGANKLYAGLVDVGIFELLIEIS
jgi:hypothetical protein